MGKFAWFVLGVILGVIVTLGAQYYLSKKAPPNEEVPAVAAKPLGPAGPLPVTPAPEAPVAAPAAKPQPTVAQPRYIPRQAAEEVAEDAAAVGMTSKRKPAPAKPPADDSIPY